MAPSHIIASPGSTIEGVKYVKKSAPSVIVWQLKGAGVVTINRIFQFLLFVVAVICVTTCPFNIWFVPALNVCSGEAKLALLSTSQT